MPFRSEIFHQLFFVILPKGFRCFKPLPGYVTRPLKLLRQWTIQEASLGLLHRETGDCFTRRCVWRRGYFRRNTWETRRHCGKYLPLFCSYVCCSSLYFSTIYLEEVITLEQHWRISYHVIKSINCSPPHLCPPSQKQTLKVNLISYWQLWWMNSNPVSNLRSIKVTF